MQQQNSNRIVYLDLLRTLATFAVVVIHVFAQGDRYLALGNFNYYLACVGEGLSKWAVPIFLMISGTIFLNPDKNITAQNIIRKRIPRLLIAYIFWWATYSAIACMMASKTHGYLTFSSTMLQPWFHLWFLPMVVCVYLFVPVLRKVAEDMKTTRYILAVWLCYILISFVFETFTFKHEIHQIWDLFRADLLIGYAGYFLLGYYLSHVELTKSQRRTIYLLGIAGAIVTVGGNIVSSLTEGTISNKFTNRLSIQIILMASALFVWAKEYAHKISPKMMRFMDYTRKDLFGIYLTHAMWLLVINTTRFRNVCNQAITLPIISIVIFILSLYTTKLIRRIPLLRKVVE